MRRPYSLACPPGNVGVSSATRHWLYCVGSTRGAKRFLQTCSFFSPPLFQSNSYRWQCLGRVPIRDRPRTGDQQHRRRREHQRWFWEHKPLARRSFQQQQQPKQRRCNSCQKMLSSGHINPRRRHLSSGRNARRRRPTAYALFRFCGHSEDFQLHGMARRRRSLAPGLQACAH